MLKLLDWSGAGFGFRMRSAALFLLTICCSISQGWAEASASMHYDISPELPILWDELRGLKELVLSLKVEEVGRRQALRNVESQLRDKDVEVKQQRQSLDRLQAVVDHQMEELRKTLLTELSSGLRRRVEELEKQSKGQDCVSPRPNWSAAAITFFVVELKPQLLKYSHSLLTDENNDKIPFSLQYSLPCLTLSALCMRLNSVTSLQLNTFYIRDVHFK